MLVQSADSQTASAATEEKHCSFHFRSFGHQNIKQLTTVAVKSSVSTILCPFGSATQRQSRGSWPHHGTRPQPSGAADFVEEETLPPEGEDAVEAYPTG